MLGRFVWLMGSNCIIERHGILDSSITEYKFTRMFSESSGIRCRPVILDVKIAPEKAEAPHGFGPALM